MEENKSITLFIKARVNIETLIMEVEKLVKKRSLKESARRIDKLRQLLLALHGSVANKTQDRVVLRLKNSIDNLEAQVEKKYSKEKQAKSKKGS